MWFALGYIAGVATCAFVAVVLTLLRKPLVQMTAPIVKAIELAGPREKGFVVEPDSEADIARQEHIRKNNEKGVDTPISELL